MTAQNPSASEIEILQCLWTRKKATVRDIHTDISARRPVGYTTILKLMQRMESTGMVEQVGMAGRAHIYRAMAKRKLTQTNLLNKILKTAFNDSPHDLILQAIDQSDLSANNIAEIRALLDKLEEGHGND